MKWVVLIIGIVLVVAYLGNYPLITRLFPLLESDYNQFLKAYELRNKIYEVMFCLLLYVAMVSNKGFTRAVFAFVFVMCAASCFDKVILHISRYLWTDILVVLVALGAAYYGYKRQSNAGQDTR